MNRYVDRGAERVRHGGWTVSGCVKRMGEPHAVIVAGVLLCAINSPVIGQVIVADMPVFPDATRTLESRTRVESLFANHSESYCVLTSSQEIAKPRSSANGPKHPGQAMVNLSVGSFEVPRPLEVNVFNFTSETLVHQIPRGSICLPQNEGPRVEKAASESEKTVAGRNVVGDFFDYLDQIEAASNTP